MFVVPPFSILDARQGYWQSRKKEWMALGIKSELGRGRELSPDGVDVSDPNKLNGCLMKSWSSHPDFYLQKTEMEKKLEKKISTKEFEQDYFIIPVDSALVSGTSIFDPVLCELAYRWFCPKEGSVLDPFAGGSVRGVIANYLGYRYTGVELRKEQVEANIQQGKILFPDNRPVWINGDSRDIDSLIGNKQFDLIFGCPPYGDLEVYSDLKEDLSTLSYKNFIKDYRLIIAKCIKQLKDDRFACFVVGDFRDKRGFYNNFVSDTIAAFQDGGMTLYNEGILVTSVGSIAMRVGKQFQSGRKFGKSHQNVLVFYKGDPKNIKDVFGDVYVDESLFVDDDSVANKYGDVL